MKTLRGALWTVVCLAVGIGLATLPVAGRTPWQYTLRAWHSPAAEARLDAVRDAAEDAVEKVKDRLEGRRSPPREHHSSEDRKALNQLLVRKTHP